MKTRKILLFSFLLFLIAGCANAQEIVSIGDILNNPAKYEDSHVIVEGIVTNYMPKTSNSTSYYVLEGDYGNLIHVNTSRGEPERNKSYRVSGTVVISATSRRPRIIESSRELISSKSWLIIVLASLIALFVILVIVYLVLQKRGYFSRTQEDHIVEEHSSVPPPSNKSQITATDLETVKIRISPENDSTLRFIGKLEIISEGVDKGKGFPISGYPTPEGNVVTIGRAEVNGSRAGAHIQLLEYPTVSRKQAELIEKDRKIFIKNLSTTNYTQHNGRQLQPGEISQIQDGDKFSMGRLKMVFHKKLV